MSYFVMRNGKKFGPYTFEQLKTFADKDKIDKNTQIATVTKPDDWMPASAIEGLFHEDGPTLADKYREAKRPPIIESRYGFLKLLCGVCAVIATLSFVAGVAIAAMVLAGNADANVSREVVSLCIIIPFSLMVTSQSIRVGIDIEANSRRAADLLDELLSRP